MRRIDSITDEMNDIATYELADGRRLALDARAVKEYGIERLLRGTEYDKFLPTERLPVYQYGRKIGTMAPDFDPLNIKPTGPGAKFFDPRPGDFRLHDGKWIAANNLCPGDFEAIPGFVWDQEAA